MNTLPTSFVKVDARFFRVIFPHLTAAFDRHGIKLDEPYIKELITSTVEDFQDRLDVTTIDHALVFMVELVVNDPQWRNHVNPKSVIWQALHRFAANLETFIKQGQNIPGSISWWSS